MLALAVAPKDLRPRVLCYVLMGLNRAVRSECARDVQTAEMRNVLEGLKEAVAALEGSAKQPSQKADEAITLGELRTELRALASSLNECAHATRPLPPYKCSRLPPRSDAMTPCLDLACESDSF